MTGSDRVSTLEVVPDAMLVVDGSGSIVATNAAAEELFGYPAGALLGASLGRLLPDRRPGTAVRGDGGELAVEVTLGPLPGDPRGGTVVVVRAASRHPERLRTALELARVGLWEHDPDTDRRTSSPEMLALLGVDPDGDPIDLLDAVHPEDRPALDRALGEAAETGEGFRLEVRMRRVDGEWRWFETVAQVEPPLAGDGAPARVRGVATDITERKLVSGRARASERLVSLGLLVAGIAHEVNTPLAAVLANLEFAVREATGEEGAALRDALQAATRIRDIVTDLRTFSREPREDGPIDVERTIDAALRLAEIELRHRARIVRRTASVPPVTGNEGRLGQVLLNLLLNAAQALPDRDARRNEVRIGTRTEGGEVVIEIADNGVGMAPEQLANLFVPFATSRADRGGTGLGLAISRRIVEELGGRITCESTPGVGTTFQVALPAAPSPGGRAGTSPPERRGRRAKVMLIDDELLVAVTVKRVLGPHHDVVAFTDPFEALRSAVADPGYDVVLCDLMMPRMSGMEVYEELGRVAPALAARTVFLTGGPVNESARAFVVANAERCLHKPFSIASLLSAITDRLDPDATGGSAP